MINQKKLSSVKIIDKKYNFIGKYRDSRIYRIIPKGLTLVSSYSWKERKRWNRKTI